MGVLFRKNLICLKCRVIDKEREKERTLHLLSYLANGYNTGAAGSGQSREPGASFGLASGCRVLEPFSAAFLGTLTESYIRSGAADSQTGAQVGCLSPRWRL